MGITNVSQSFPFVCRSERMSQIVDWALALLLIWAFVGFEFGNSDDYSFLPWVFQHYNESLYARDIRFAVEPSHYYYFHIKLLYVLSKVLSIPYVFIVLNGVSIGLLLYSIRRLVRVLWSVDVPVSGIALLMLVYGNQHLVAGYYLYSKSFSTHYPAIALTIIALSAVLERSYVVSLSVIVLALLLNPRSGLVACVIAVFVILMQIWKSGGNKQLVYLTLGLFFGVTGVVAGIYLVVSGSSNVLDDVVRFWVYVRSPGHYLPSYWSPYTLINFGLIVLLLAILFWRGSHLSRVGSIYWVVSAMMVAISIGIINNQLMFSAPLVLANPLQFGPIVLALAYVLLIGFLYRNWRSYLLPVALIVVLPTMQLRLVAMIVVMMLSSDDYDRGAAADSMVVFSRKSILMVGAQLVTITGFLVVLPVDYLQIPVYTILLFSAVSISGFLGGLWLAHLLQGSVKTVIFTVAATQIIFAMSFGYVNGVRIDQGVDPGWKDMCNFVKSNTETDALFVIPPDVYDFQARAMRSAYASFVHIPLHIRDIPEWIDRLGRLEVYPTERLTSALHANLTVNLTKFEEFDLAKLKSIVGLLVDPIYVIKRDKWLGVQAIYSNGNYYLYRL